MNTLLAAAIVAIAILIAGHEIAKHQRSHSQFLATAGTIANMAAILMAARLSDGEYMKRVEDLRTEVEAGGQEYPGSSERVEEWEIAKEMLKKIDYDEASVQKQWIGVAEGLYWQTFWQTRDAWQVNFNR